MGTPRLLDSDALNLLEAWPGWESAVGRLQAYAEQNADRVDTSVRELRSRYSGQPAAAIVDTIASRQRRYKSIVLPFVREVLAEKPELSLRDLAAAGLAGRALSRHGEPETVRSVAAGLLRFGEERGLSEWSALESWAAATQPLVIAPRLDPYVGIAPGIGVALFAYLRMLAGADGVKPDVRVRKGLASFGFPAPAGETALVLLCETVSGQTGLSLTQLDQLLWLSQE